MAVVYKAYQPSLDRYVALKVLADHLIGDPEFVRRFQEEARTAAKLEHPNIVPIHEVDEDLGAPFISMRLIEGETLADYLARNGRLPSVHAASLVRQIASALDFAHSKGIVHRDVKPSNVLIDPAGRAYLMDFGIARAGDQSRYTRTGALIGTPEYMSPEQVQGEEVGPPGDRYSLGVVAYEIYAGYPPFQGNTVPALLHAHVYEMPVPLTTVRSDIPGVVEAAVARMLAKRPESRWETCSGFVEALNGEAARSSRTSSTTSPPRASKKPAAIAHTWSPLVAAGAVLLALFVLIAGRGPVSTDSPESGPPFRALAEADGPTATPSADERWSDLDASLGPHWGNDWEGVLTLLDDFLAEQPDYGLARDKRYSALVAAAGSSFAGGDASGGIALLERADSVASGRGEAAATLVALTPTSTARPTATRVPASPTRAPSTNTPRPGPTSTRVPPTVTRMPSTATRVPPTSAPARTVPCPVRGSEGTDLGDSLYISWSVPACNGSAPITGYVITFSNLEGDPYRSYTTPAGVTSITVGQPPFNFRFFCVKAQNAVGLSSGC